MAQLNMQGSFDEKQIGVNIIHLAVQNTGRGGTGAEEAKDAQREIIEEFLSLGESKSQGRQG